MNNLKDKHFYKVISLFIKAMLLSASFYYIIQKIIINAAFEPIHQIALSSLTIVYLMLVMVLMACNWLLEAKKWQLLIAPLEQISITVSMQSILAGITISIFTPNRIGEFAGRIFFLKKADKLKASVKSMVGSFIQLSITLIMGLIGMAVYYKNHKVLSLDELIDQQQKPVLIFMIISVLLIMLFLLRIPFFVTLKHYLKECFNIKKQMIAQLFWLSLCRYAVFTVQYYFILLIVGVEINFSLAWILIAITFFITAAIPTFALTEIIVRSAIAVYVFHLHTSQPALIASASVLLWAVNLALPAVVGSLFLGKLHFFKKTA